MQICSTSVISTSAFRRYPTWCLINLINSYDEATGLVKERRVVGIVYLDFSKAFNPVSHKVLIDKLLKFGLDEQTVRWIEN